MPDDVLKNMGLQPSDAATLLRLRAMYITQLLTSIASATASNLKLLFARLEKRITLHQLADLDSCLLSSESLYAGWAGALANLLVQGTFDLKAILISNNIKPITRTAITSCGGHSAVEMATTATSGNGNDDASDAEHTAEFSWRELFNYGSSPAVLESDLMLMFQLQVQTHLLDMARGVEKDWRDKVIIHVTDSSTGSRGRSKVDMCSEIWIRLDQEAAESVLTSPIDATLNMYRLPADFKLMFFGSVGDSTA